MAKILVVYYWENGADPLPEFRDVPSLSELDLLVQEEMHESMAFDDAVKRIEFYVRVEGKFPKYIMTKEVAM